MSSGQQLFCSIIEREATVELRIPGKHRLHREHLTFTNEEGPGSAIRNFLKEGESDVDAIWVTYPMKNCHLISDQQLETYRKDFGNKFRFRTLPTAKDLYAAFLATDIDQSFDLPVYELPAAEVFYFSHDRGGSFESSELPQLFLFLQDEYFFLLLVNDREILAAVPFSVRSSSDVLYYSLFVLQQNRIDVQEITTVIAGRGLRFEETENLLKKHLPVASDFFEKEDDQHYCDLKSLVACAS